ncbi:MAG: hypothetical protein KAW12_22355 [Candidatus Aminicenantes bacterium]|nr:hypothetical protein [Candidatus Aminicenantes bacterium]
MAKCAICNSRKGKRQCPVVNAAVCSLCCGENREKEKCADCSYYNEAKPARKYNDIPRFSTQTMEDRTDLQQHSDVIEGTLCAFDLKEEIDDPTLLRILECLLDDYYFKSPPSRDTKDKIGKGYIRVKDAVDKELADIDEETLVKLLGVIYFVAKRRSRGGREHINLLHNYVGAQVEPGLHVRMLKDT